jgi:hypothetical protein
MFDYETKVIIGSIGMVMTSFNVGLGWRYLWLKSTRSSLMKEPTTSASRFNSFATLAFAICTNTSLTLWLLDNDYDPTVVKTSMLLPVRAQGRIIVGFNAFFYYSAFLGNLLEILNSPRGHTITTGNRAFAVVYGLIVILLLSVVIYGMSLGEDGWAGLGFPAQAILILWTSCLLSVNSFMPEEPAVTVQTTVGTLGETDEDDSEEAKNCSCPSWLSSFSIIKLLNQSVDTRTFYPKEYLGATHEVFGITLVVTWVLTLVAFNEQIFYHPAQGIIGSYNPCFGWDYAPASWIAVTLCAFNVYFSYRYAWLKAVRNVLLKEPTTMASRFNNFATYALGVSSNLWLCLWLIGPNPADPVGKGVDTDGPSIFWWSLHTGLFVFYAASTYCAYFGNLLDLLDGDRRSSVETKHLAFAAIYGLAVAYLLLIYFYSLSNGSPLNGSGVYTQVADIIWMSCVSSVTSFMPNEPPLKTKSVVSQPLVENVF